MPVNVSPKIETQHESGLLLVDKPAGWTSHDIVKFIRGFGFSKVGHCGTLDPLATGLLIIVFGKATKLSGRVSSDSKTYQSELCLGTETDTQDADGKILTGKSWTSVTENQIEEVFNTFKGEQKQIPPMYSAKKVKGKTLYKLARKGIEVVRDPVCISIFDLQIISINLPTVSFEVMCSKGTYVRTLCCDIGSALGCGGHLKSLRRTASSKFRVDDAVSVEQIRQWKKADILEHSLPITTITGE